MTDPCPHCTQAKRGCWVCTDEESDRAHHPDCPALFFTDKPERCRCMFLAMLDRPRMGDE